MQQKLTQLFNATVKVGFPGGSDGKESACNWVRKIPWREEWLSTPVFLPGEFYETEESGGV